MKYLFLKLMYLVPALPVVLSVLLVPITMHALSEEDLHSIYNDTVWYKAEDCIPSVGGIARGSGAPNGAQFPNLNPDAMASAIDKWIVKENPRSTMKSLGSTIVASAKNSNVSPFLIVTIARHESWMADPSDFNVKNANNAFGRTATQSQPRIYSPSVDRYWYKWSSVKASVDFTAPENKNAIGGGDIASYLREQYGNQINKNDFIGLFLEYAPPGQNNTPRYIALVKSWLNELVNLASGPANTDGLILTTDGCVAAGVPADNFVFYTQNDPRWANYRFGSSNLATSGCGPTSVAMVVATLADSTVTPKETADFGTKNGAYIEGQGSSWQKMLIDGPQNWGLKSVPIGTDFNKATEVLRSGGLVIASGQGLSPFTAGGHILVIRAVNTDGSFLVANTISSLQNSRDQKFTANQLINAGLKAMFAVTK